MFVFVLVKYYLSPMLCFIIKTLYFTDVIEKRAEFPLFLDAPDNTSCRYF
ncbi:hypothetical protein Hanom_Chr00s004412g01721951 [Helianthus anomalus]